jgi:nitrite reductase (NADH) small subunit
MESNSTLNNITTSTNIKEWFKAAHTSEFPENGGAAVMVNGKQIAIFNFTSRGEWYASQNVCPHKLEMALSRGLIGDSDDEPKVSCPFHKKNFSLHTGECMNDDNYSINIYPVEIRDEYVYVGIPDDF